MRRVFVSCWLLLWSTPSAAGPVVLAFNHDLNYRSGTTYMLHTVSAHGGVTRESREVLPLLTAPACAAETVLSPTAETLCARLCLEPGDYRLTVFAVRGSEVSDESTPALEVDLTSTTPCRPVTVGQQPAGVPPGVVAVGAAGVVAGTVLLAQNATPPSVFQLPNMACVSPTLVPGGCVCGFPPHPCVRVEYYEPGWLVETVKHPGTTSLALLSPLLDAALAVGGGLPPGGGGAANASSSGSHGQTNLQYSEAHVFTFPQTPLHTGPCSKCVPTALPVLHYASELDVPTWRIDKAVPSPLDDVTRVLSWGRLYPRAGKAITGSAPVASGLTAFRAFDIAFQPIGTPPNLDRHVVLAPTGGYSRCMQLAWPKPTPCMPAGTPANLWETAATSPTGSYVWIIWRHRECCVEAPESLCGLTLPGVGGHGDNWCPLSTPPSP